MTPEAERLASIPDLAGTVVSSGKDARFEHPVDLIISSPQEMQEHERQMNENPEIFDGIDVGVLVSDDPSGPEQAAADAERFPGALDEDPASCAQDLEADPNAARRWVTCFGSGDIAAYAIPSSQRPDDAKDALRGVSSPVPQEFADLGYTNPAAETDVFDLEVATVSDSLLHIDLQPRPGVKVVESQSAANLEYVNAMLVTALDYADRVQFTIDGSCEVFSSWAGSMPCELARPDVQPRENR